jgi:hypothetical protein
LRSAVFLINGLGDQLIAWPTLRALRSVLPGELELWLGLGMMRSLYRDIDMARYVIAADGPTLRELDPTSVPDDHHPVDLFVSLSTWCNASVMELARRLGSKRTVGLAGPFDQVAKPDPGQHMFDRLFAVARFFDSRLVFEDFAGPPTLSPAAEAAAQRFVARHLAPGERMLFVHPETRATKMWTAAGFGRVLSELLAAQPGLRVFLTSREPYQVDVGRDQGRVTWLDTPFEMTLAILRHADLFLGVDSCFLHGADLLRVPGVGLFGPTSPEEWGFRVAANCRAVSTGGPSLAGLDPGLVRDALMAVDAAAALRRPGVTV